MHDPTVSHPREHDLDVRIVRTTGTDVATTDMTYRTPFLRRRAAYLVRPAGDGPHPVILYVHWYEPEACDSCRVQFLAEARAMALRGVMSLLVETIWSDRDWFIKRTHADDFRMLHEQSIELRCALDLLLSQPDADAARLAYVGHDFGAMFGVLVGSADRRPSFYVLAAGTPRWADWFLYYPRLDGEARAAYAESLAPLDPVNHVATLAPRPVLFQFARRDPHVPSDRASSFYGAAGDPKEIRWYDAGHALDDRARDDRIKWLAAQFGLSPHAA